MSDPTDVLDLEPDDLDGHTIEELSDYLDHDRQPADASIDNSPACQMALTALLRLTTIAGTYLDDDGTTAAATDEDWIGLVLAALPLELRRGRSFPIPLDDPALDTQITEGALRGLIRATGDAVPGVLTGTVRIEAPDSTDSTWRLQVEIAIVHGTALVPTVQALRADLFEVAQMHAPFPVARIDVTVTDVLQLRRP